MKVVGRVRQNFIKLKVSLASFPVVFFPDFGYQFVVTTDTSDVAVRTILERDFAHALQPVALASRSFNNAESRYSAYERELLGIVSELWQSDIIPKLYIQ